MKNVAYNKIPHVRDLREMLVSAKERFGERPAIEYGSKNGKRNAKEKKNLRLSVKPKAWQ